jgi:hypothetical protein
MMYSSVLRRRGLVADSSADLDPLDSFLRGNDKRWVGNACSSGH